ncbi:hypothetical protein TRVL_09223 [Trypanosoma vivax]|nr:hypothetical protein TRVL_09223 [Trypanosoma vivax]
MMARARLASCTRGCNSPHNKFVQKRTRLGGIFHFGTVATQAAAVTRTSSCGSEAVVLRRGRTTRWMRKHCSSGRRASRGAEFTWREKKSRATRVVSRWPSATRRWCSDTARANAQRP